MDEVNKENRTPWFDDDYDDKSDLSGIGFIIAVTFLVIVFGINDWAWRKLWGLEAREEEE